MILKETAFYLCIILLYVHFAEKDIASGRDNDQFPASNDNSNSGTDKAKSSHIKMPIVNNFWFLNLKEFSLSGSCLYVFRQ